jgi:hypothetical protein
MAKRVVVHVGLPKSGTTYLQGVLGANRARLRERSEMLYPGPTWGRQVEAVRDLLDANPHGERSARTSGAWQRLVEELEDWPGGAVISMEWLCAATPAQARTLVSSLSFAEVEVAMTVRDLGRTLPAAWQEFMRNWETESWAGFLDAISSEDPLAVPLARLFWSQQDVGRTLAVWRDVVPDDRIHVITVPHPGAPSDELWRRVAQVLDVVPEDYDSTGRAANESIGLASAELLRVFNERSREAQLGWSSYAQVIKEGLAKQGLAPRRSREPHLAVPPELHAWLREEADRQVRTIEHAKVNVVGDLSDLMPILEPGAQPDDLEPGQLVEAALDGLVYLARLLHTKNETVADADSEIARLRSQVEQLGADLDERRTRPFKRAAIDLSERHRSLHALRSAYWSTMRLLRRGSRAEP